MSYLVISAVIHVVRVGIQRGGVSLVQIGTAAYVDGGLSSTLCQLMSDLGLGRESE